MMVLWPGNRERAGGGVHQVLRLSLVVFLEGPVDGSTYSLSISLPGPHKRGIILFITEFILTRSIA